MMTTMTAPKVGGNNKHSRLDVRWADTTLILADPDNERPYPTLENDPDLQGLMDNIRERGLLDPLLVYEGDGGYILLSGHRRHAALRALGWARVMVRLTDRPESAANRHLDRLTSNLQRKDVGPIEAAQTLKSILHEAPDMTQAALAAQLGWSQPKVAKLLGMLDLPEEARALVADGSLSAGHAAALAGVKHPEYAWSGPKGTVEQAVVTYAKKAAAEGWPVRKLEQYVKQMEEFAKERIEGQQREVERDRMQAEEAARLHKLREAHDVEAVKAVAAGRPAPPLPPELDEAAQRSARDARYEEEGRKHAIRQEWREKRTAVAKDVLAQKLAFDGLRDGVNVPLPLLRVAVTAFANRIIAQKYSLPATAARQPPNQANVSRRIVKGDYANLVSLVIELGLCEVGLNWQGGDVYDNAASKYANGLFGLMPAVKQAWAEKGLLDDPTADADAANTSANDTANAEGASDDVSGQQ